MFARCVKQLGFYTIKSKQRGNKPFARCVKQLGFYTNRVIHFGNTSLLGVLNN